MADPHALEAITPDPGLSNYVPENTDATQRVADALRYLTELEREVVQMRAGAGLKHRQVGEILWPHLSEGHSTNRAAKTYNRAVKKIRDGYRPVRPVDPVLLLLGEQTGLSTDMIRSALASLRPAS